MILRLLLPLLLLSLAGCWERPRTFEDDKLPPKAPILTLADMNGIVVEPVRGATSDKGQALAEGMAAALQDREVLASATQGNAQSLHLVGTSEAVAAGPGIMAVKIRWSLQATDGSEIAADEMREQIPSAEWAVGSGERLADAMKREAPKLAAFVQEKIGPEHDAEQQVFVRPVEGAPGDGNKSLPRALVYLLKRAGVTVTADVQAANATTVVGTVALTQGNAGTDHVVIAWHVLRPGGGEVGQVKQENNIPHGSLDGNWGDIAMAVANAAVGDIVRVMATVPPAG